jgi:copper(I)-binding protein
MKTWMQISLIAATLVCNAALAQNVTVADGWVRATVPGQKGTGAFMKLTAKDSVKLLAGSSPAAGVVEVHEMKMDKDVMKMAALPNGLDLPAGKTVELKPGSYHVMLMDLKAPLAADSTVPITLVFQDAKGNKTSQEVKLPVKAMTAAHSEHKH